MKIYSIPSVASLDSSNLHFFKNQATCGSEILNGQTLAIDNFGGECGFGTSGTSTVFICLSGVIDPSLLNGLIVDDTDNNAFLTSNCFQDNAATNCPTGGYVCTVNGTYSSNQPCITSLACPDGTVIDVCSDTSQCSAS